MLWSRAVHFPRHATTIRNERVTFTWKAQASLFGLANPADAIGKTDFDFFSDVHAREAFEAEQEILRTGRPMLGKVERETWSDGRESCLNTEDLVQTGRKRIAAGQRARWAKYHKEHSAKPKRKLSPEARRVPAWRASRVDPNVVPIPIFKSPGTTKVRLIMSHQRKGVVQCKFKDSVGTKAIGVSQW